MIAGEPITPKITRLLASLNADFSRDKILQSVKLKSVGGIMAEAAKKDTGVLTRSTTMHKPLMMIVGDVKLLVRRKGNRIMVTVEAPKDQNIHTVKNPEQVLGAARHFTNPIDSD